MAKFGKFVGQSFELNTNDERNAFENVLESVFDSLGDVKLFDVDNELGDVTLLEA